MRDPKQIIEEFPGEGLYLPLVEAVVAASSDRIKPATVTGSPRYRSIPRIIIGGKAYTTRADLIEFFTVRMQSPAARRRRGTPATILSDGQR